MTCLVVPVVTLSADSVYSNTDGSGLLLSRHKFSITFDWSGHAVMQIF